MMVQRTTRLTRCSPTSRGLSISGRPTQAPRWHERRCGQFRRRVYCISGRRRMASRQVEPANRSPRVRSRHGTFWRGPLVVDSTNTVVDIISASHQGDAFRHMLRWNLVVCSSVVLRRSAWLESGLRFEGSHSSMEDYSMWLGLAARCRFSISPNLLVRYHVTSSNKTSARTIDLYREHLLAVFEQLQRDEVSQPSGSRGNKD